jgi:uncharacterized membrane protein
MDAQNYANHVYRPTAWAVTVLASMTALVLLTWAAFRSPSLTSFGLVLLALVVVLALALIRTFALRLQNRIIRVEMRARLTRIGREGDLDRIAMSQLVAARFASDRELPALLDRALGESLTADQIKRAVTDWQGDHLRT